MMEKQSARLLYRGKDHKDIIFQGKYHNALIKNNKVIWYKIYDNYCITLSGDVIDIDKKRVVLSGITDVMQCEGATLIAIRTDEKNVEKIYSSIGMIFWEKVKEVDVRGYSLGKYYRQRSPRNSIVYEKYSSGILYLKILKYFEGELQEKNVEIPLRYDYMSNSFSDDHIFTNDSDLVWIYEEGEFEYIVHIVKDDGAVISKSYDKKTATEEPYTDLWSPIIYAEDRNKAYYVHEMIREFSPYPQKDVQLWSIDENGKSKKEGQFFNGYGYLDNYNKRFLICNPSGDGFVICIEGVMHGAIIYPNKGYTGGVLRVPTKEITLPIYDRNGIKKGISGTTFYGNTVSYCGITVTNHPQVDKTRFIWQLRQEEQYGTYVVFRENYKEEGFIIDLSRKE